MLTLPACQSRDGGPVNPQIFNQCRQIYTVCRLTCRLFWTSKLVHLSFQSAGGSAVDCHPLHTHLSLITVWSLLLRVFGLFSLPPFQHHYLGFWPMQSVIFHVPHFGCLDLGFPTSEEMNGFPTSVSMASDIYDYISASKNMLPCRLSQNTLKSGDITLYSGSR